MLLALTMIRDGTGVNRQARELKDLFPPDLYDPTAPLLTLIDRPMRGMLAAPRTPEEPEPPGHPKAGPSDAPHSGSARMVLPEPVAEPVTDGGHASAPDVSVPYASVPLPAAPFVGEPPQEAPVAGEPPEEAPVPAVPPPPAPVADVPPPPAPVADVPDQPSNVVGRGNPDGGHAGWVRDRRFNQCCNWNITWCQREAEDQSWYCCQDCKDHSGNQHTDECQRRYQAWYTMQ